MFEEWKKKYIDWEIGKLWKDKKRNKQFLNWHDVKSIVILYDRNTLKPEQLKQIFSILDGKQVMAWTVVEKDEFKKETINVAMMSPNEWNLLMKPKDHVISRFKSFEADILIDLTFDEILPLKYLHAVSDVKCRCGLTRFGDLTDFSINRVPNMKEMDLLNQIIHYMTIINQKGKKLEREMVE